MSAGTLLAGGCTPVSSWFAATWRLTDQNHGISAVGLQRMLGLGCYETAWAQLVRPRRCDRHDEALRDFGEVLRERLVFDEALRERLVFDGLAVRRHRVQQVGIDRVVAAVAPDCVGSLVEGVDHVAALAAVHAVSARPAADGRREHHVEDAADKDLVGLVAEVHRNPFHIHRRAGRARAKTGH